MGLLSTSLMAWGFRMGRSLTCGSKARRPYLPCRCGQSERNSCSLHCHFSASGAWYWATFFLSARVSLISSLLVNVENCFSLSLASIFEYFGLGFISGAKLWSRCSPSNLMSNDMGHAWLSSAMCAACLEPWKWPRAPPGADKECAPAPRPFKPTELDKLLPSRCWDDKKRCSSDARVWAPRTCWNFLLASNVYAIGGAACSAWELSPSGLPPLPGRAKRAVSLCKTWLTKVSVCCLFSSHGLSVLPPAVAPKRIVGSSAGSASPPPAAGNSRLVAVADGDLTRTLGAGSRMVIRPVPAGTADVACASGRAKFAETRGAAACASFGGFSRKASGKGTSGSSPDVRMSLNQASRCGRIWKAQSLRWLMQTTRVTRSIGSPSGLAAQPNLIKLLTCGSSCRALPL
mmetsp:Transcript_100373/g.289874  ORF Transcript_100373/g.289874 Transcript_100373/m.289874 type:complete len:403 (-) Transcript_100373:1320-2528(-)